ncbi:hypothetical protein [Escherichia albertii]|uniref:hypothetical protein n=1 Tax=Escherichia albertii TaxID=208962 RepID=UPI0007442AD6|nr:hypothetical protein [Escherichia albertii]
MIRRASISSGTDAQLPDARERLIRPTVERWFPGMIRRASVASGICAQLPDAACTPYPAYKISKTQYIARSL